MNTKNFKKVLDHIKADPSCWNQATWHCGTQHCFAGWAQLLAGKQANDVTVRRDARVFLNLSKADADYLFRPTATIENFELALTNRAGYDQDGYDQDGYNRAGYDRAGYDQDGLDAHNRPRP